MNTLSPFATLILLLALVGAGFLAAWLNYGAVRALDVATPAIKARLRNWMNNLALRRALRDTRPMTEAERQALREGAQEAMESFRRAQVAIGQH